MDLALNNLQRLICYKTQQTKSNNPLNLQVTLDFFFMLLDLTTHSSPTYLSTYNETTKFGIK